MNEALFFISKSCQQAGEEMYVIVQLRLKICLLFIGLFLTQTTNAQISISDFNVAHLYDPLAEISVVYNLEKSDDELKLHAQLTKHQGKADISDYRFTFYWVNSYSQRLDDTSIIDILDSTYLGKKDQQYFITFTLPQASNQNLLVVKVLSRFTGYNHYYDVPLATRVPITLNTDTDSPIIKSWINPGRYKITNQNNVYGYFYTHEFPAALPPMVTRDRNISRNMVLDSTFTLQRDEVFVIKEKGLYLIQSDTTSNTALSFRLEDKYFPKSAKLEQLVDPLIYITTKQEKKSLQAAKNSKAEFDQFWIDLTRSSERARDIIKNYYERVENANQFFTTYKSGWKTDRGMIYIIFGPPNQVLKTNNEEKWVYLSSKDLRKLEFKFVRAPSIFSNSHYVLIRDKKYADSWFKGISRIRQGRFR